MSPLKRLPRVSINYASNVVVVLCMLPSLLLSEAFIPRGSALVWVMWAFVSFFVCGGFYSVIVLMRLPGGIPTGWRFIACLFAQAGFWYLLIRFNAA